MLCLACAMPGWPLCDPCIASLKYAPPSRLGDVPVEAAFRHVGAAVRLVHNLKYRRSILSGRLLAAGMASGVPADASVLVPMPRSFVRRVTYGIDQASVLASELGTITGLRVVRGLGAPLWWRRQAGADRKHRHAVGFSKIGSVPAGAVLVDDVLTTGATAMSAVSAIHGQGISVLVATSAGTMETGAKPFLSLGGDVAQMRETSDYPSHAARPRLQMESFGLGRTIVARPIRSAEREEIG